MCTGMELVALAGAAASTVGGLITRNEQEENAQRMAEARNNELKRTLVKNDSLAESSRDTFDQRNKQIQADEMAAAEQDAKQNRQETLETAAVETPAAVGPSSISGSAPTVVKSELAKRMSEALNSSKDQAKKLGTLGGYGDHWLNQGFEDVEAGRGIAQDANFASGNMAILPYQQDFAETRAYKPISPIGGLLQGFGSMASSYGGGGGMPKKTYKSGYI